MSKILSAKDIKIKNIPKKYADELVKKVHYSGKVCQNSQINLGVFINDKLEGVMQFGPSIDKKRMMNTVKGTKFNDFIELNRMAFSEKLPRNSESRAISIAMRILKKTYPNIEWVVSFADGCQCGDGTIYRASGFKLIGVKRNTSLLKMPNGKVISGKALDHKIMNDGRYGSSVAKENGAKPLSGYQIKYIYFLNKDAEKRLSVKILPFDILETYGAKMYKGKRLLSIDTDAVPFQGTEDGENPINRLHSNKKIFTEDKNNFNGVTNG